ncbi:SpoIIE family protein phosphatase [Streptomyces sp. SYSU K217416]
MASLRVRLGSALRRLHSTLGPRTVAGQMFVLVLAIVLLLVSTAAIALVLQDRRDAVERVRERAVAIATTFAESPETVAALRSPNPTAILQPRAESVRQRTGVRFVVVLSTAGIRYTHPDTDLIGKRFVGHIEAAAEGRTFTETFTGPSGETVRAVVPVIGADRSVIGLVAVGVDIEEVTREISAHVPVLLGGAATSFVLAVAGVAWASRRLRLQTHGMGPIEITRMYEHHEAVLHSVREGVLIVDDERRLVLANDEAHRLLHLPADTEGRHVTDLGLTAPIAELLSSGRVADDEVHPARGRLLSVVVNHRPAHWRGRRWGSVATLRDITELHTVTGQVAAAQERLTLAYEAGLSIGTTLDVRRTAEELAEAAVPEFADFVTVDLPDAVLRGDEPPAGTALRRTAMGAIRTDHPLYPLGRLIRFESPTPQAVALTGERPVLDPDLSRSPGAATQDPVRLQRLLDYGIHSLIVVPLRARGVVLGVVSFWRQEKPAPFEEADLALAEELVGRAAVCIDNARRYTREHTMALTLQRSLLPRWLPAHTAVDVAHRYLPSRAGVGGDWFDVIPLSAARVALVVGDVVGRGLHAAATMGRLRTAVHNFATLDLPPDEVLAHLDDLVARMAQGEDEDRAAGDDSEAADGGSVGIIGATCLYAVYDPVSRSCTMARAGHLPPAVVYPNGSAYFPELPAGPPLGLGGLPFESAELHLPEGSRLVLYTDGLVAGRDLDIEAGLQRLRRALSHSDHPPQQTCDELLDLLVPADLHDDVALLVARTHGLDARRVAGWDLPADPAVVHRIRSDVTAQLADWDLAELEFSTELMISELVTNAIRYGGEPIRLRLIRDHVLTCEVWDGSSTSPRLRRAATTDEGGRGLFLVAQLSQRWGTRYTADGKVIWTEQPLPL